MGVIGGGEETPLSAIGQCRMEVQSSRPLDMNENLYLINGSLLKSEWEDLESTIHGWLVD